MSLMSERIESMQHTRNMGMANVAEKAKLREKLDAEMEAYLARGGQIKPLKLGETSFNKNGTMPMKKTVFERAPETPSELIEQKNKLVRLKSKRGVKPHLTKEEASAIMAEQKRMINEFALNLGAGDRKRFCDQAGISEKTFTNAKCARSRIGVNTWERVKALMLTFKPTITIKQKVEKPKNAEGIRRKEIADKKLEAELNGQSYFEATCKTHGYSRFVIYGKQSARCEQCAKKRNKSNYEKGKFTGAERVNKNKELLTQSVANGEMYFIGDCKHHGEVKMKIYNRKTGHDYRCTVCVKSSQAKYNLKRTSNESKNNA